MILLTGTYTTSIPFEVTVLLPKIFESRQDIHNYVRNYFSSVLRDMKACRDECLKEGWEMGLTFTSNEENGGVTYNVYAEKTQGIVTYHLRADTLHIVYRTDDISIVDNKVRVSNIRYSHESDALYWNISPNEATNIALNMSLVSGYAAGKMNIQNSLPETYTEMSMIVPEDDPVTPMIVIYTMLRANGQYALFHIQDGSLYLYSKRQGFISMGENVQGFEDGLMCDPDRLYAFSPMYKDIPSTIDTAVDMFHGMFKTDIPNVETLFRDILLDAFSPGLQWRSKMDNIIDLLSIEQNETDATVYTLMRIVAKHKLLKGANLIFSMLTCSIPDAESP